MNQLNINNNIINEENRPKSAQKDKLINHNNKMIQPVNKLSNSVSQQNFFNNKFNGMPHISNSKSSLPNSQHSFPIKNSNLISFNSTENNQGLKLSFNPSLLNNNNALNPITVFESNCIPPAGKPIGVIETFQKPTLIGLNNIGSTCYKNSVLQC